MTIAIDEEAILQPGRVAADRLMLGTLVFLLGTSALPRPLVRGDEFRVNIVS